MDNIERGTEKVIPFLFCAMRGYSKLFFFFIPCFFFFHNIRGQDAVVVPSLLQAMGGEGVSLGVGEASVLNPASASSSNFLFGVSYSNRFLLKDLAAKDVILICPVSNSRAVVSFGQFGNEAFRENHLCFGLAKSLGARISGGILFHYIRLQMAENLGQPTLITLKLGFRYESQGLGSGISIFNPLGQQMKYRNFLHEYPMSVRVGVHKWFGDGVLVLSQLSYDGIKNIRCQIGLQYNVLDRLCFRTGLQTLSPGWSLGLGFFFCKTQADFAFSCHEYLGFSPSVSLYFKQP